MGRMLKGASAIHGVSLYLQVPKLKLPVLERNSTLITGVLSALFSWTCPQVFPPVLRPRVQHTWVR